jgi:hypothetical protein
MVKVNVVDNSTVQEVILQGSDRKKKPSSDKDLERIEDENSQKTHQQIMENCKASALKHFHKDRYVRKNFEFETIITPIQDVKPDQKTCSIRGEVLFKWEKQIINEKWAKTDMVCLDLHDGTGSVIVAIPLQFMAKKAWELEIGMWVELLRAEAKEKYPNKICILATDSTQLRVMGKTEIPQNLLVEPEQLGLTLSELELEPVGRVCNVVGLVVAKTEKHFIKSLKGNSLVISKL